MNAQDLINSIKPSQALTYAERLYAIRDKNKVIGGTKLRGFSSHAEILLPPKQSPTFSYCKRINGDWQVGLHNLNSKKEVKHG
jgi:hypothetical protein